MNVDLTPELERLVQSKMATGRYSSASEVVLSALLLMDDHEEVLATNKDDLRRKIEDGILSAKEGRLFDGDEVFAELEAELDAVEIGVRS